MRPTERAKRLPVTFLVLAVVLAVALPLNAATLHVPADFPRIQDALDAAANNDTVLVAPGEYVLNEPLSFNRLHDPLDPQSPALRNFVLRSDMGAAVTTLRMGVPGDPDRGSVIAFEKGEGATSVLAGFKLIGGAGTRIRGIPVGGGVLCMGRSSPTIRDCEIASNAVGEGGAGGGVYCDSGSRPLIQDCAVRNNAATDGGGIFCHELVRVESCLIAGNFASMTGGGVYIQFGNPTFRRCVIAGNLALDGGGLRTRSQTVASIDHCTVTQNSARDNSAIRCGESGPPFISNSIFWQNNQPVPCGRLEFVFFDIDPLLVRLAQLDFGRFRTTDVAGTQRQVPDFFIEEGDYHLRAGSLAVDRGDPSFPLDADGTRTDIGALPFLQENPRPPGRIVVDLHGNGDFATIEEALNASVDGDEILVREGQYNTRSTVRFLGRRAKLFSESGPERTVVKMEEPATGSVFRFEHEEDASAVLEGLTITGGNTESGGGIAVFSGAHPTIRNCRIVGNQAVSGGGIHLLSSSLVEDCVISGNVAASGGGVLAYAGQNDGPTLLRCRIYGNQSTEGGGVRAYGRVAIRKCILSGNVAANYGGGAFLSGSDGRLESCTLSGNVARVLGSGLFVRPLVPGQAPPAVVSCILWNNVGEALFVDPGGSVDLRFSCVEGKALWPGPGNINLDPRFAGWLEGGEIFVDPERAEDGDGSPERPYRDLRETLGRFSVALSMGSPCLQTGLDGKNMGAVEGDGMEPQAPAVVIHLAPDTYALDGVSLGNHVSLAGAGRDATTLVGKVFGLRTGSGLEQLKVIPDRQFGVVIRNNSCVLREVDLESPQMPTGIALWCTSGAVTLIDCRISGAEEQAVLCQESSLTMRNCTVRGASLGRREPAVELDSSSAQIVNSTITENGGPGLSAAGKSALRMDGCIISRNIGAGVAFFDAGGSIYGCRIRQNRGGGVAGSSMAIEKSEIVGNSSGGISGVNFTVDRCLIAGNDSRGRGGGIKAVGSLPVSIRNTLVLGNFAEEGGGGLALEGTGNQEVLNCTIVGNRVGLERDQSLSALWCRGRMQIKNCIFWDNDVNRSTCRNLDGSLMEANPLFVRPGVFDLEVFTSITILGDEYPIPEFIVDVGDYHLRSGSPAIDSGVTEGAPEGDYEGVPRPCGLGVDAGAYESGGCEPRQVPFIRGDVRQDGRLDITDAVAVLNYLFTDGSPPLCMKGADVDDNARVELTDPVFLLNYMFLSGPQPEEPFLGCDEDASADTLTCDAYSGCG